MDFECCGETVSTQCAVKLDKDTEHTYNHQMWIVKLIGCMSFSLRETCSPTIL